MKVLQAAWVMGAVFKVHHEAVKSQKQDGGGVCLDVGHLGKVRDRIRREDGQ